MENCKFEMISNDELNEIDGGSVTVVLLIIGGATMVISAGVSAFNGYQEEKRRVEQEQKLTV